jgi:hypothetical protein
VLQAQALLDDVYKPGSKIFMPTKVEDVFITATSVHEVGNALFYNTNYNPRPLHDEAFREVNPGAALEDCVFGGKVKTNGQVRTTPETAPGVLK